MKFNEKLKDLRIKKGMTQEDLASALHITRQSVSKWEQGINEPSIQTIKALSVIFQVSLNELIDDDHDIELTKEEKLKRTEKIGFIINAAISIFTVLITCSVIRVISDHVPMHYDMAGRVIRYGSKYELFMFCGLSALFFLISMIMHRKSLTEKRRIEVGMVISQFVLSVIHLVIVVFVLTYAFRFKKDGVDETAIITMLVFAIIMIVSVCVSPYFIKKYNPYAGFRTEFTRNNQIAWKKINRLQSISGFITSLIGYIITTIFPLAWSIYLIGLVILSLVPTIIYQEILKYRVKKGMNISEKSDI